MGYGIIEVFFAHYRIGVQECDANEAKLKY